MKNLILVSIVGIALTGCVMKQKIMDASVVSMTQTSVPEGSSLQDKGTVTGKFCSSNGDKGAIGLFDEAVKNAQSTSGVDFIANATFWNEGGCVTVEGTGQKLMASGTTTTTTTTTAPAKQDVVPTALPKKKK